MYKISIQHTGSRFNAYTSNGKLYLFTSYKGIGSWAFFVPLRERPIYIAGEEFPSDYALRLAQSLTMIELGLDDYPEVAFTKESERILKKAGAN